MGLAALSTFALSYRLFLWPPLYCEDGLFFAHYYNDASASLLWSYNGYVSLFPNALAWLAARLPPTWAPYVLSGAALLLGAVACALPVLTRFRAILPSDRARLVVATMLALWPLGDFAMAHTGVYSLWHLLLVLILLSVVDVGGFTWGALALLGIQVVAVWSHPLSLCLVPAWVWGLFREKGFFARAARCLLIVAALAYYAFGMRHRAYAPWSFAVLERTGFLLAVRVFLEAWVGPRVPVELARAGHGGVGVAIGVALGLAPLLVAVLARRRLRRELVVRWLVLAGLAIVLMWVSATTRPLPARADLWAGRYYYLPQYLYLLVTACVVVTATGAEGWSRVRGAVVLAGVGALAVLVANVNRHAWWAEVPKDGRDVGRALRLLAAAERGDVADSKVVHRRGKWSLELHVKRVRGGR